MRFLNIIKKRWKATKSPLPPRSPWTESPKGKSKGQGKDKSKQKSKTKAQNKGKNKGKYKGKQKS